jgi:hypothetical protein
VHFLHFVTFEAATAEGNRRRSQVANNQRQFQDGLTDKF